jgi:hypothetical protein
MNTQIKAVTKTLNAEELSQAQTCIFDIAPGNYEVSKILGEHWVTNGAGPNYGTKFRASVNLGLLKNIRFHSKNRSHHLVYTVYG